MYCAVILIYISKARRVVFKRFKNYVNASVDSQATAINRSLIEVNCDSVNSIGENPGYTEHEHTNQQSIRPTVDNMNYPPIP